MNSQEEVARLAQGSGRKARPWLLGLGAVALVIVTALVTIFAVRGAPSSITGQSSVPALTPVQQSAVDSAVAAIGKINAAVEVGVNFPTYGQLLIDAKAATNHAVQLAPTAAIASNLQETMQNYVDAAEAWQFKIKYSNLQLQAAFGQGALIKKYDLLPANKDDEGVDPDTAMQKIWSVAGSHYRELLLAQSGTAAN